MDLLMFYKKPVWIPEENKESTMKIFKKHIERNYKIQFHDYWEFRQWSVEHIPEFWAELWDFLGIVYSRNYDQIIDLSIPMENSKWFEGARLNYAENMLRYKDDRLALIVAGEDRDVERITYSQLYEEVRKYAASLRKLGIKKGDRISCLMSNRKEAIIAMLATTSIGAIWVASVTVFGAKGCITRLKSLQPKIIFTVDQYQYNKNIIDLMPEIQRIEEAMPCLEEIIIVPSNPESKLKNISNLKKSYFLDDFLEMGHESNGSVPELEFEQMSMSDPVFIVHSSGTTGAPKPVVHGSGVLLTMQRDYFLHWNVKREDVWLVQIPPGWSTWNDFSMLLFVGATIVLFEGSPYFLCKTDLWDLVDKLKITTITMTANIFDEMESREYLPTEKHNLSSLKMILAFGNVVLPQTYEFVLMNVKKDITFSIMYACTDIISSFALTDHNLPLYKGEITTISLGVAAEVVDKEGNSVTGKEGEFVLAKSVPSFPLGIWGDPHNNLFKELYLSKYPGKFTLGDAAMINPITHGIRVMGRSDEMLRPNEVIFRSYHIYDAIKELSEIQDAICIPQYKRGIDVRVLLFVKMQEGHPFNQKVVRRIQNIIELKLSEKHVPEVIVHVPDLPYNENGKKMEDVVKRIINNLPISTESVANPDCLKYFYNNLELRGY